jgi:FixJ family two-component response regulator
LKTHIIEAFKNSRVTVLDDDRLICESLTEIIQSWGLCVEGFTEPEAAIEHIGHNNCDLILLDVFIRDVCGLDLIQQFGDDLKVIVITGSADKDLAIRALKLGVFDFLEKPFQNELLQHSILRALTALENERASKKLITDIEKNRSELLTNQHRLENLHTQLLQTNRTLSIFAQNIEREREGIEKRIGLQLRNLIMPLVVRLRNEQDLGRHAVQLDMLAAQIEDLTSAFLMDSSVTMTLSLTELRIASLIKNGITSDEIARQLNIAESTVRTHRKNIRKKLNISKAQYSLRNFFNLENLTEPAPSTMLHVD